eukprot:CAMPEP_0195060314 /NCGR_PEP_ID=MMETSP0448-20130528/7609_1 /TAXON_ID=66468 /ORGANISM="Heterocapsa triquestra, Strain CCMP 448" /LENGTH=33 /DNA_ID= /DNA_START= /DNA_END= /DNA_ORIENTATION=
MALFQAVRAARVVPQAVSLRLAAPVAGACRLLT